MSGAAAHRRSRSWVVGAWLVPVLNLWVPRQVLLDIWRASAPRRPVSGALVNAWGVLFAATLIVRPIQWRVARQEITGLGDVQTLANVSTLLTVLNLATGVLIILIIRRVTAWQTPGGQNTG
jgi:Domain of unknown function (DUF4328)